MFSTRAIGGASSSGPDTMIFAVKSCKTKPSDFGTVFTGPAKSQATLIEVFSSVSDIRCHQIFGGSSDENEKNLFSLWMH